MSDPQPQTTPTASSPSRLPLILGAAVVALGVGGYFAFFAGDSAGPGGSAVQIGDPNAGPVDIDAYIKANMPADKLAAMSYEASGNVLTNVVVKDEAGQPAVQIAKIEVRALDTANKEPNYVDVHVEDLVMEVPEGAMPGVTQVKADIDYAFLYDPAAKTLEIPGIVFDAEGLAKLTLSASLTDIAKWGGDDQEAAMNDLAGGKLKALSIVLNDKSFIKAALTQAATEQGTDLATMTVQAQAMLAAMETQMTDDISKQAIAALKVILGKLDGSTLTITANPSEPFPFANFAMLAPTEGGMPDLNALAPLNLKISAE